MYIRENILIFAFFGFYNVQLVVGNPPLVCEGDDCIPWAIYNPEKQDCNNNENYTICGTPCPQTCLTIRNPSLYCAEDCVAGCFCLPGYVREIDNGPCIPMEKCPFKPACPANSKVIHPCNVCSSYGLTNDDKIPDASKETGKLNIGFAQIIEEGEDLPEDTFSGPNSELDCDKICSPLCQCNPGYVKNGFECQQKPTTTVENNLE